MNHHIFFNQSIRSGALVIVALLFLCGAKSGETRNIAADLNKSGIAEFPINQLKDSLPNAIFTDPGVLVKSFISVIVDDENTKWFITEKGILSYNGKKWTLHDSNTNVPTSELKDFALEVNQTGSELWIASPKGATVAAIPVDEKSTATTYHTANTPIMSNNVFQVAVGKSPIRWFGTDKGISAFRDSKWLKGDYEDLYPPTMFQDYPILSMATTIEGDSLYIGTDGAGVSRVQRNQVDGITGASSYAQWGPILLPSDKICSIFIASNNTQWFGTDKGLARHVGGNTLTNWTTFTTKEGLVDNFVQAITADKNGQIWVGTKGGASLFDGAMWKSLTKDNGLISNNILSIAVDKSGVVWFCTDNGISSYLEGKFSSYK